MEGGGNAQKLIPRQESPENPPKTQPFKDFKNPSPKNPPFQSKILPKLVRVPSKEHIRNTPGGDGSQLRGPISSLRLKTSLTNPRELIDNRVGGIVNVSRPDAIAPMQQSQLNPFVFQTIKMLDENMEDTTGVSRISQGTNKDAVSKQNSAALVEYPIIG